MPGIEIDKSVTNGGGVPTITAGLNLPVDVGVDYSLFLEVSTGIVYFAKTGIWVPIAGSGGAPTLQDVTNSGHSTTKDIISFLSGDFSTRITHADQSIQFLLAGNPAMNLYSDFSGAGPQVHIYNPAGTFATKIRTKSSLAATNLVDLPTGSGTLALTGDAFLQPHIKQTSGAAPTFTLGPGAGAGATISLLNCTDTAGHINIFTGVAPAANSDLFTITFGTPFSNSPMAHLQPNNPGTAFLLGVGGFPYQSYNSVATTYVTFKTQGVPLTGGGADYSFSYFVTA